MYLDTRNMVLSALLLGAIAATWYFGRAGDVAPSSGVPDPSTPLGYYLRNAVLLGTNDQGRIFYRIHAERVSETGDGTALSLERVSVEYHEDEDVGWRVSADHARTSRDEAFLDLSGGVRLTGNAEEGASQTVIETERLRLAPDEYLASTTAKVAMNVGRQRLAATGMRAHLKDDRLELLSEVHGQLHN